MNDLSEEVWDGFWRALYGDLDESDEYYNLKPQLAHYTTLVNLENILRSKEVWLSNPLFMNDLEEVRFGVSHGYEAVSASEELRQALGTEARAQIFYTRFHQVYEEYVTEKALDLYIMCFCEHEADDDDGRLSMWRGYGGSGDGVAIVFDTAGIAPTDPTPLALAKVHYGTVEERRLWIQEKVKHIAAFMVEHHVPDEYLPAAAESLFERIGLFAVFSKHKGFQEEREWRLVYLQDRDPDAKLKPMFGYHNGPRGIEPKLKLKVAPLEGVLNEDTSIERLISKIIIGPTMSSALSSASMCRMFDALRMPKLRDVLVDSSIPFRK